MTTRASGAATFPEQSPSHAARLVPGRSRRQAEAAARRQTLLWRLVAVLLVLATAYLARSQLLDAGAHPRSRVQRITLVHAPKPLPPKPLEKPPEVQVQKNDVDVQSQPIPDPSPSQQPDDQLGVDADGEGAGDGFGLVGKRGGQDITTLGAAPGGAGGTASGNRPTTAQQFNFRNYGGLIGQRLQSELMARSALRGRDYVSVVLLWIDAHGRIERVELQRGSGYADIDSTLRQSFADMPLLPEPPAGLPQPLSYRVASRDLNALR
jgi:protein TonB